MARILASVASILIGLLGFLVIAAGVAVRGSLPDLEGRAVVPGLTEAVEIDRDDDGVPTIRAAGRLDAARALGFLHAQERYFQMDLMRRKAAGRLAELFGVAAADWDRRIRVHRLAAVADQSLDRLSAEERALVDAYVAGVNAGLDALDVWPVEYLLLRSAPAQFEARDVVLVVHAMFLELTPWTGQGELARAAMADLLPAEISAFLGPAGCGFDAPIVGEAFTVPPIPGPGALDLRAGETAARDSGDIQDQPRPGSNAWAVSGERASGTEAILANDMHLGLGVPNTWYRALVEWRDEAGGDHFLVGVTLPGTPLLVVGSNSHVAWGFTNSYADVVDVVPLDTVGPDVYVGPDGPEGYERYTEVIQVAGSDPVEVEYAWTVWGPVVGEDHLGRPVALRWTAHRPEAVNLALGRLETAMSVEDAVAVAGDCGIPPQNLVLADRSGRVAWTIAGRLPRREMGADGRLEWRGWLDAAEMPRLVDPADGLIWTANARVVGPDQGLGLLGDGGYALGARAGQIRDRLREFEAATEADMLKVQLDDEAWFLAWWRDQLLGALDDEAIRERNGRGELRRVVEQWSGRAAVDDPGYRMVRAFRLYVRSRVLDPLTSPCEGTTTPCGWRYYGQREGALRALVAERPAHLLSPEFGSWKSLLLAAADQVLEEFTAGGTALVDHPWGERNTVRIRHPMSTALPDALARRFDMPLQPLPGDQHMPRVQTPGFGASERLVVAPGREADGFFHMPAGQSGHPWSEYYGAGHDDWAQGAPTPLLPGPTRWTLQLRPD